MKRVQLLLLGLWAICLLATSKLDFHCYAYTNLSPPFWRTPWAYLGYIILLIGGLFVSFQAVQRRERNKFKRRQMEQDVLKTNGETPTHAKKKSLIFVVGNNENFVSFLTDSLSLYYTVQSANNGQEAWKLIPDLMPDLILSDFMMPYMDGNELCRWVKTDKRTANIPFILLTAKQSVENKVEGFAIGADYYVANPFNMEALFLRVRKLIDLSGKDKLRTQIEPDPSDIIITSLDEKLIEHAIKYVESHISRSNLSVEELSRELGMSRVHLYKKLLQITGKTPIEFIRIIRLRRAAQLLRKSQQNVSEIAYQLGFNNPKYFSKYFKGEFGVLPSVYQEKEGI